MASEISDVSFWKDVTVAAQLQAVASAVSSSLSLGEPVTADGIASVVSNLLNLNRILPEPCFRIPISCWLDLKPEGALACILSSFYSFSGSLQPSMDLPANDIAKLFQSLQQALLEGNQLQRLRVYLIEAEGEEAGNKLANEALSNLCERGLIERVGDQSNATHTVVVDTCQGPAPAFHQEDGMLCKVGAFELCAKRQAAPSSGVWKRQNAPSANEVQWNLDRIYASQSSEADKLWTVRYDWLTQSVSARELLSEGDFGALTIKKRQRDQEEHAESMDVSEDTVQHGNGEDHATDDGEEHYTEKRRRLEDEETVLAANSIPRPDPNLRIVRPMPSKEAMSGAGRTVGVVSSGDVNPTDQQNPSYANILVDEDHGTPAQAAGSDVSDVTSFAANTTETVRPKPLSGGVEIPAPLNAPAWYNDALVSEVEKRALPEFFCGKYPSKTEEVYIDYRRFMIHTYATAPDRYLTQTACRRSLAGDVCAILRVHQFLEHWGLINYNINPDIFPVPLPRAMQDMRPMDVYCQMQPPRVNESRETTPSHPPLSTYPNIAAAAMATSSTGPVRSSGREEGKAEEDDPEDTLDGEVESKWTDQETLLLLKGLETYGDDWKRVSEYVGTKSKAECVVHFLRMPIEDPYLDSELSATKVEGASAKVEGAPEAKLLPFAGSANPVMALVAFLGSEVHPHVAAAAAKAALKAVEDEEKKKKGRGGPDMKKDDEISQAAAVALGAAAAKARVVALRDERLMKALVGEIVEKQVMKLEVKLAHFQEMEEKLEKERAELERSRQTLAAERMALRDAGEKLREAALKTSARENGLSMSSKTGETGDGRAIESSQSTEGLQPMESQNFATLAPGTGAMAGGNSGLLSGDAVGRSATLPSTAVPSSYTTMTPSSIAPAPHLPTS